STALAVSRNRCDSSGSSPLGLGLRGMDGLILRKRIGCHSSRNGNSSCGSDRTFVHGRHALAISVLGHLPSPDAISFLIGEPLTLDARQGEFGTAHVINSAAVAVRVAEIKFRQIPMQMRLADVVIDANNPALENGKIVFDGVAVDVAIANILIRSM